MIISTEVRELAATKGLSFSHDQPLTQERLQTWLRNKHEIIVCVIPNFYNRSKLLGYIYTLDRFENGTHDGNDYDSKMFHALGDTSVELDTFEEAFEAGLLEALKLINNET